MTGKTDKLMIMRACPGILLCGLWFFLFSQVFADVSGKVLKEGNRLFRNEKYDEALEKYNEALTEEPDSDVVNFNHGAVLYKKDDYERAAGSFNRALVTEDSRLEARASYNLGNSKYRQGKQKENADLAGAVTLLRESLDYYKRAIELDERDEDAKFNHELVERELKILLDKLNRQQQQEKQQQEEQQKQQQEERPEQQGEGQQQEEEQQDTGTSEQEEKEEQQESRQGEEEEPAGERAEEPERGEGEEEKPREMSEEEARMLLDGYRDEEEGERMRMQAPVGRFPEPVKDW